MLFDTNIHCEDLSVLLDLCKYNPIAKDITIVTHYFLFPEDEMELMKEKVKTYQDTNISNRLGVPFKYKSNILHLIMENKDKNLLSLLNKKRLIYIDSILDQLYEEGGMVLNLKKLLTDTKKKMYQLTFDDICSELFNEYDPEQTIKYVKYISSKIRFNTITFEELEDYLGLNGVYDLIFPKNNPKIIEDQLLKTYIDNIIISNKKEAIYVNDKGYQSLFGSGKCYYKYGIFPIYNNI